MIYDAKGGIKTKSIVSLLVLIIVAAAVIFELRKLGIQHNYIVSIERFITAVLALKILLLFFSVTEFTVEGDKITFTRNLFVRKKIFIQKIQKIEAKMKEGPEAVWLLNFYDDEKFSENPFSIPISSFNKEDLTMLISIVTGMAPSIKINEAARQLKDKYYGAFNEFYFRKKKS